MSSGASPQLFPLSDPGEINPGTDNYVLYAEDNPSDVIFFSRAFRKFAAETQLLHCDSGPKVRNALTECVRTERLLPRLVVLDIKMPGLSGLEVLEYIRNDSDLKNLPVVMLSASGEQRDINRAYDLRANAYLIKPDRYKSLQLLVGSLAHFWIRHNRRPV
jgi:CheY-like chemotaxis protein